MPRLRASPEVRRRAILGALNPRHLSQPQPGWFRLRLVRGGVFVPASIYHPCPMVLPSVVPETNIFASCRYCASGYGLPHGLACELSGVEFPDSWCRPEPRRFAWPHWPVDAEINGEPADPFFLWERGERITRAQYTHMREVRLWAETHAPHHPEANPRARLDLRQLSSLF